MRHAGPTTLSGQHVSHAVAMIAFRCSRFGPAPPALTHDVKARADLFVPAPWPVQPYAFSAAGIDDEDRLETSHWRPSGIPHCHCRGAKTVHEDRTVDSAVAEPPLPRAHLLAAEAMLALPPAPPHVSTNSNLL